MASGLQQPPRLVTAIWSSAIVVSIIAGSAVLVSRKFPPESVDDVLSKVATLDSESRSKICAHRSNNIPMYQEALRHFDCIEIDVHINPAGGSPAAVYHPPKANNHGLTLDFLLSSEPFPAGKLWLDTKDLSNDNWAAYLDQLKKLIPGDRRDDVIVETVWSSPDVRAAAAAFRSDGFKFSYYLPTDEAIACAAWRTQKCDTLRRQVLSTASMGFSHLSFDAKAYAFVKSIHDDLPSGMKLLTWDLTKSWPKSQLLDEVEVYIVKYPSPFLI